MGWRGLKGSEGGWRGLKVARANSLLILNWPISPIVKLNCIIRLNQYLTALCRLLKCYIKYRRFRFDSSWTHFKGCELKKFLILLRHLQHLSTSLIVYKKRIKISNTSQIPQLEYITNIRPFPKTPRIALRPNKPLINLSAWQTHVISILSVCINL